MTAADNTIPTNVADEPLWLVCPFMPAKPLQCETADVPVKESGARAEYREAGGLPATVAGSVVSRTGARRVGAGVVEFLAGSRDRGLDGGDGDVDVLLHVLFSHLLAAAARGLHRVLCGLNRDREYKNHTAHCRLLIMGRLVYLGTVKTLF